MAIEQLVSIFAYGIRLLNFFTELYPIFHCFFSPGIEKCPDINCLKMNGQTTLMNGHN